VGKPVEIFFAARRGVGTKNGEFHVGFSSLGFWQLWLALDGGADDHVVAIRAGNCAP